MRPSATLTILCTALLAASCSVHRSPPPYAEPRILPGPQADGSVLLPNQWSLRPVGRQIALGDFPLNVAVHPDSRFAAVLHCGYSAHEIVIVDIPAARIVSRVALEESFYGLAFSPDGRTLYCSGAGAEVIHAFDFQDGLLALHREIVLRPPAERGVPAGLAISARGRELFAANLWGQTISRVQLTAPFTTADLRLTDTDPPPFTGATQIPADPDLAAAAKRTAALLDLTGPDAPFPFACRLDEKRNRLYVSLWSQAAVAVIDLKSNTMLERWPTQEHPNELLLTRDGRRLFVANASRNSVTVLDADSGQPLETLSAAMQPNAPPGSTPNSLALSPDETLLFVANADNNNLAVFDVTTPGRSASLGFIPVGWYPTSVRVTPDGKHLLVANGKGLISKANPHGPQPGHESPASTREYIGSLMQGTLSVIPLPTRSAFLSQLAGYTAQALRCPPAPNRIVPDPANPVPAQPGADSPIKYCFYVIKENRTYDQVLGDLPQGNGDASLCLFPERVTPNHHQLARDFVLLDNFYVESEVSADGHEWTVGAYATDFVEKTWPLSYGHNQRGKFPYPSEGKFKIAEPAGGYLWDRANAAGVSYRNYGEFINAGKTPNDPATTRIKSLRGHFDEWYRPWDLDYPDVKRVEHFAAELQRFERAGDMPRLQILRLGNDHTYGTSVGKLTPTAMVAENDLALGKFVELISHSRFWPQSAIFVVEDDAQNGPDHVDAHRTIAYAISPFIKRGAVDSTPYTTSSLLRTIELILGLEPMTQFDAAARPLHNSFRAQPDLRPYRARPANVDLQERNTRTAWGSEISRKLDFAKEDAADDLQLNRVIWHSVRGANAPLPAPTRAAFVFPQPGDRDRD